MQTVGIVLNVGADHTDEFERGFREMEAPTWGELHGLGKLTMATLSRLDISTKTVKGAVQYLVVAIFSTTKATTCTTTTRASVNGTRGRTPIRSVSRSYSAATQS